MNTATPELRAIFWEALDYSSGAELRAYLERTCGADEELRSRVEALLRAHRDAGSFLEAPISAPTVPLGHPAPPEAPGTPIGSYKLLEQIGEGGMGVVYMAEQTHPVRRKVALKIIKPGMDTRQVIARFEAERQALAMMDHPNIAKVLDAGATDSGRPYFVMELVKGFPITDYCDANHLSLDERLDLFVLVCQAVQHAHQKGVIHRDIKPSNVLISLHDGVPVPKVIDFGIAKATGQSLTDKTLFTAVAQLIGTPLYMSPEQAGMSGIDIDTRSDIYSLGVLLYELLTGSTPFDRETFREAALGEIQRIFRDEEPPKPSTRLGTLGATLTTVSGNRQADPRRLSHAVRGELDWIVMKALEKDRTRRYGTASDFASDVMRHLSDRPVEACPPSAWYRSSKSARRNRATLTTASLVAAALLIGTVASAWQAVRATQATAQAQAKEAQARAAARAEARQRRRAEASERQAQERLVEVERQRTQAEKNLEAALEAVDRMLAHVEDSELNDIPRVGLLRRRLLQDAVAFYERIPLHYGASEEVRFRVAQTWDRIGYLGRGLGALEQSREPHSKAVAMLEQLAAEQPRNPRYRATLAGFLKNAGYWSDIYARDYTEAEKRYRRSSELYAELAHDHPKDKSWSIKQADSLFYLAGALLELGKRDEAIGCHRRVLDVLDLFGVDQGFLHARTNYGLAKLCPTPAEADGLFRRALSEFRNHFSGGKKSSGERGAYAGHLRDVALRFASRYPDEAEKLLDESLTLWREMCDEPSSGRDVVYGLVQSLLAQARHRRRAAGQTDNEDQAQVASRLAKAEVLFQEAITQQRQSVSRFAFPADRSTLVQILQEQSGYLLGHVNKAGAMGGLPAGADGPNPEDAAARRLQADALLTEAIQIGRQLVAEFPKDWTHGDRLTAMLRFQAEHFGPKEGAEKPEGPPNPDPDP